MDEAAKNFRNVIIFGGSGFIGKHLINYLSHQGNWKIINFDITEYKIKFNHYEYIKCDISKKVPKRNKNFQNAIIFCLASYFKSDNPIISDFYAINPMIARNVCSFADQNLIKRILYISTSECYGISEDIKNECKIPEPNTPYGISKFIAENSFRDWCKDNKSKKLVIVRPGVAFGKGEKGSISKLYQNLKKYPFLILGSNDLIKSVIYVKDLVSIITQMVSEGEAGVSLYNISTKNNPSVINLSKAICSTTNLSKVRIPINKYFIFFIIFYINIFNSFLKIKTIALFTNKLKKLFISTNIDSSKMFNNNFKIKYSLNESLNDWFNDCGKKGLF